MIDAHQVDAFAAIEVFAGLEIRNPGTSGCRDIKCLVIVAHLVVPKGDERRIGHQDALELGVLNREPGDHDPAQAGMIFPIDVEAVRLGRRVDDRPAAT